MTREQILTALERWIAQRPGLEHRNYISHGGDDAGRKSYFAESRSITRDRHDAERLLRAVALTSMPVETLREGFRAYSGRLTLREGAGGSVELAYCTGQYWPTEYRRAACAVLAHALWEYRRGDYSAAAKGGESVGHAIRRSFAREFGLRFARRWFDA